MKEGNVYPTLPVAQRLRNLREYLPDQSKFLYRFANHVADRLTPKHMAPHGIYGRCFPDEALHAFLDIRLKRSDEDIVTVYGYDIPKHLLGHPMSSYFYLFDSIPAIFMAITEGSLRSEIITEIDRLKHAFPERLDALNPERTQYKAARSGLKLTEKQLEFVDFPSTLVPEIEDLPQMPPLLFHYDTTNGGLGRNATYFVPLEKTPGFMQSVAWARAKTQVA
jgi:hypothetical protein